MAPTRRMAEAVESGLGPFAGDAIQFGVQNHHVLVAVENLGTTARPLAIMAGQPIVGPALALTASHGLFELAEVL